jgi:hypothetical protein
MIARLGLISTLAACFSAPAWTEGPRFAQAKPPAGFGIIYVYREVAWTSALAPVHVRLGRRSVDVLSGSYAVLYAKPGKQRVSSVCAGEHVAMTYWGGLAPQLQAKPGGPDESPFIDVEVESSPDKPVFVRVECQSLGATAAQVIANPDAEKAIANLSLTPGGRGRVAWDDL